MEKMNDRRRACAEGLEGRGELKLRHLLPGSSAVPIILGFETLIHRHPLTDEDELS